MARRVFGDRLELAVRYAARLSNEGVRHGHLGPREVPRLWDRHLVNCALLSDLVPAGARIVDVGSGAGLPGLVIATRRPDLQVTLVEPLLRRVRWLDEVVQELDLTNVTICRGRAEALWDEVPPADVVTSRAVSALENLAVWSVPLVRPGGWWLPMKGASVADEIDDCRGLLADVGITSIEIVECGAGVLEEPTTVARLGVGTPRRLRGAVAKKAGRAKAGRAKKTVRSGRSSGG